MEFRPPRTLGTLMGGLLAAWCYLLVIGLVVRGVTQPVSLGVLAPYLAAVLFFGLGGLFAYWTYSCHTLRYMLDRNGLSIHWGDIRQTVPVGQIERLVPGREAPPPRIAGVSWLGHHVGQALVERIGDTLFYSTHRSPEELLYVVTPSQSYAISVEDEVEFAGELQSFQKLGALVSLPQATERVSLAAQPFWQDRLGQGLALAAVVVCATTLGYVFHQYPGLPESLPLSFPSLGGVVRVASKHELLTIPSTGVGLLLVNLVLGFVLHGWERMVGYLLLLAALAVQGILLAGAIIALT
jgi:hypothetical protein